jgi:putative membrane protein
MIRAILLTTALSASALLAPAALAGAGSGDAHTVAATLSKEGRDFVDDAAEGGLLEVKLGQMVVKRGASDDVKRFAQKMVDDHGKVNQRLADLARQDGIAAPQELDKKHQDKFDKLAQYSGNKLDEEYMGEMISEHQDDVKAFEKEAKDGKDPALRQFAASTLPTLEEHLSLAKQVNDHLKK